MGDRIDPRERLAALAAAPEAPGVLGEAALWIAAEEYPDLDVGGWLGQLAALGRRAAERVTPNLDVDATAAALGRVLFEEEGFHGNTEDYYDPRNSFLNDVLERRLGIPITLSIVYIEVAARAGVRVRGVGLPGHFIVRMERPGGTRLLDPFHGGRALTEADCDRLVERVSGAQVSLDSRYLRPVTTREILVRMLRNLKGAYVSLGDWNRALVAVDRILLLAPEDLGEVRDRGGIYSRAGQTRAAIRDWETYITRAPDAPDVERVRESLRALRQALASLN